MKSLTLQKLLTSAHLAGIELQSADRDVANMYVWTTSDGEVLYVGIAENRNRIRNEVRWATLDHTAEIVSPIVALLRENQAVIHPLTYSRFDGGVLLEAIDAWHGKSIDAVRERVSRREDPTLNEVEQILIRIVVRTGSLIGNSQYASQWEKPIGSFTDTVAAIAVDRAREEKVIPSDTPVRRE